MRWTTTVLISSAVGVAEKAEVTTVDTVTVPFGVVEGAPDVLIWVGCDIGVGEAGGIEVF